VREVSPGPALGYYKNSNLLAKQSIVEKCHGQ